MPPLEFATPSKFFEAVAQTYRRDSSDRSPAVRPGGVYFVQGHPVKFVVEKNDARLDVRLDRIDWSGLSRWQRLKALCRILFMGDLSPRYVANSAQTAMGRYLVNWNHGEALTADSAFLAAIQRISDFQSSATHNGQYAENPLMADPKRSRESDIVKSIVQEFSHELIGDVLPATRELFTRLPIELAEKACRETIGPLRERLDSRLNAVRGKVVDLNAHPELQRLEDAFEQIRIWGDIAKKVGAAHKDPEIRRDRIGKAMAAADQIALQHKNLDIRAARIREAVQFQKSFATLHYSLDQIPEKQADVPAFTEVALGDVHGNCEKLLHSLAKLGFLSVKDASAWLAAIDMLKALEAGVDVDCAHFRKMLWKAVRVERQVLGKELVLLGDWFGDRRYRDDFMLAIASFLRANRVHFKSLLGNHDAELVKYYLMNHDKPLDQDYTYERSGMHESQCISLVRLHKHLNANKGARVEFLRAMKVDYLPRLKLLSYSSDRKVFYSHAFVNGPSFEKAMNFARVTPLVEAHVQVDRINQWFHEKVLVGPNEFKDHLFVDSQGYHPIRACAFNRGPSDAYDQPDEPPSGPSSPSQFSYALHGHTIKVSTRIEQATGDIDAAQVCLAKLKNPASTPEYLEHLKHALCDVGGGKLKVFHQAIAGCLLVVLQDIAQRNAPHAESARHLLQAFRMASKPVAEIYSTNETTQAFRKKTDDELAQLLRSIFQLKPEHDIPIPELLFNALIDPTHYSDDPTADAPTRANAGIDGALRSLQRTPDLFDNMFQQNLPADALARCENPKERRDLYLSQLAMNFFSLDNEAGMHQDQRTFSENIHFI